MFKNPIIIGHSFGSMIVMILPELQRILRGLIILNSSPKLWYNPTKIDNQMIKFINNPNKTNFREVLDNSLFGYFHPNYVDIGRRYISNISIDYKLLKW